jgi:hypothetical protein
LTKDVSTSFWEPLDFLSAALKLSTEKSLVTGLFGHSLPEETPKPKLCSKMPHLPSNKGAFTLAIFARDFALS